MKIEKDFNNLEDRNDHIWRRERTSTREERWTESQEPEGIVYVIGDPEEVARKTVKEKLYEEIMAKIYQNS